MLSMYVRGRIDRSCGGLDTGCGKENQSGLLGFWLEQLNGWSHEESEKRSKPEVGIKSY